MPVSRGSIDATGKSRGDVVFNFVGNRDIDHDAHVAPKLLQHVIAHLGLEVVGILRGKVWRTTTQLRVRAITPQLGFYEKSGKLVRSAAAEETAVFDLYRYAKRFVSHSLV